MGRKEVRKPHKRGSDEGMDLPRGKTCSDCVNFDRCGSIYGLIAEDAVCDWYPSRFKQNSRALRGE